MGPIATIISSAAALSRRHSDAMLKDVKAEHFARLATVGGVVVQSNHPAFVYGHLSLYFPRALAALGQEAPANPPMFEELFLAGKPCLDDPEGKIYPSMEAILSHYNRGFEAAANAVRDASDADFNKMNPNEGRSRELFPTVGALAGFIFGSHISVHLGQVSAWRRMMGLGSAM